MKSSNLRRPFLYIIALFLSALFALLFTFPFLSASADDDGGKELYVGGMTAGFLLGGEGARIVGFNEVKTEDGVFSPAAKSELKTGDSIIKADGYIINGVEDLTAALKKSGGRQVALTVLRSGKEISVKITPVKDLEGNYKIGVLIRDSVSGIGTVTYIEKDTLRFGALGHAVVDENGRSLGIADSKVYPCSVVSVVKGVRGRAGELKGLFVNSENFARAEELNSCGIYGRFSEEYDFSSLPVMRSAAAGEAHMGRASIYSTVSGTQPVEYSISIVKVDEGNKENKNFVIKIEDKDLLSATGGIVQGMSGSPIIQDDKVVGAVTHVFLNDPARGYGISIDNMLGN